ncbi:tRNA (adenosine(37)-N6)-dimethylallyltransferase MiaA [Alicyclobacillus sp. SO9]|uniref:tRNA (adenosine(37)-N6)-dimethylallyltransferase MiaA n=1 Tax=Alicyclobacillus sp. SO9 TaxID=2665646 RepID=UPI0018E78CFA|nr:tRNA (adenosine(37)-N6)-dimethylallyltransferase MiaA [Alicyclobacillus sp. SO9]QQE80970.1 tRNA (adenosine(37)-N6)-dimethylallyltransferase MiaA [Alicyclobacillus sp. SO9]
MANKPPVLCIVGPTGIGKSDFGVSVAKAVGGEVVSADSMQIYKKMDIGTGKLREDEMQGVPHYLIDIAEPDATFSVAQWTKRADEAISSILRRQRLPIVVGGTGLYIRSITENLDFGKTRGSAQIRQKWEHYALKHGQLQLHKILEERDKEAAQRLHPNDVRRVIRALEVLETGGKPFSDGYDWSIQGGRYDTVQFGLRMNRQDLYARVEHRIDKMLETGLFDEVESLLRQDYNWDLISMQAIGYKELASYFRGLCTREEAVALLKRNTRRFVKRQMSWFGRDGRIKWLDVDPVKGIANDSFSQVYNEAVKLKAGIQKAETE